MKKWTVKYKTDVRVLTLCIGAKSKKSIQRMFEHRSGQVLDITEYKGGKPKN